MSPADGVRESAEDFMEPVQKKKLYHDVLDRLMSAISTSEFPPGSQLPSEKELMGMIGVGRPSIREAMLTLQQMAGVVRQAMTFYRCLILTLLNTF